MQQRILCSSHALLMDFWFIDVLHLLDAGIPRRQTPRIIELSLAPNVTQLWGMVLDKLICTPSMIGRTPFIQHILSPMHSM